MLPVLHFYFAVSRGPILGSVLMECGHIIYVIFWLSLNKQKLSPLAKVKFTLSIFSSTGQRPASYCHALRPVSICPFVCVCVCVSVNFFFKNFSETIDWIFTKFHWNVPKVDLFQIPSNNCVP